MCCCSSACTAATPQETRLPCVLLTVTSLPCVSGEQSGFRTGNSVRFIAGFGACASFELLVDGVKQLW